MFRRRSSNRQSQGQASSSSSSTRRQSGAFRAFTICLDEGGSDPGKATLLEKARSHLPGSSKSKTDARTKKGTRKLAKGLASRGAEVYTTIRHQSDDDVREALITKDEKGRETVVYPTFVLVVATPSWHLIRNSELKAIWDFLNKDQGTTGHTFAVFTAEQSKKDDFKSFFRKTFEVNTLYRHHLAPEVHEYYKAVEFEKTMSELCHTEIQRMSKFILAKSLNVVYSREEKEAFKTALESSVGVPVAIPLPNAIIQDGSLAGVEATARRTREGNEEEKTNKIYFFERGELDENDVLPMNGSTFPAGFVLADIPVEKGGIQGELTDLVGVVLKGENPKTKTLKITFSKNGTVSKAALVNARLNAYLRERAAAASEGGDSAEASAASQQESERLKGIVLDLNRTSETTYSFSYTYEIELFDVSSYNLVKRIVMNSTMATNRKVRNSMEALSTNRWRFYDLQPKVREDLMHMDILEPPLGGETQPKTWRELLCGTRLPGANEPITNTVTVPITLYGPKGVGKSSLAMTWEHAACMTFFSWLESSSYASYASVKKKMPKTEGHIIYSDVPFSSESGKKDVENPQPIRDDAFYSFSDFDQARLVVRDTKPARDTKTMITGRSYPIGMMVLVLNATEVLSVYVENASDPDMQQLAIEWRKLIGTPDERKTTHSDHLIYPPIAAVLTVMDEGLSFEDLEHAEDAVRDNLGVEAVFSSKTFAPMSQDDAMSLLTAREVQGRFEDWKVHEKEWERTAVNALEALSGVIETVLTNETAILKGVIAEHGSAEEFREEAVLGTRALAKSHYLELLTILRDNFPKFKKHGVLNVAHLLSLSEEGLDEILADVALPVRPKESLIEALHHLKHLEDDHGEEASEVIEELGANSN